MEGACLAREREESGAILPDRSVQRHSVTLLETARSLANCPIWGGKRRGWGRSMYFAFLGNCSVSYLSFVYGRSLGAELNDGENFLHWKANMLPLFSIMTLCTKQLKGLHTAINLYEMVARILWLTIFTFLCTSLINSLKEKGSWKKNSMSAASMSR